MPHDLRPGLAVALGALLATGSGCARPRPVAAVPPLADGAGLFQRHCTECHGASGHGDGHLSGVLSVLPSDLTTIAQRNGGLYPFARVRRTIDGRGPVAGHGGAGMPVWGDALLDPRDGYDRASASEKIDQLTRYLESIQSVATAGR